MSEVEIELEAQPIPKGLQHRIYLPQWVFHALGPIKEGDRFILKIKRKEE